MLLRTLLFSALFISVFSIKSVQASHFLGHEIFYSIDENGIADLYVVFYRECAGIAEPQVAIISAVSSCGDTLNFTANQTGEYGNDVWPFLPFDEYEMIGNCPKNCQNGTGLNGVQRFVYSVNVQLPTCTEWRFSYEVCCVSGVVTNIASAGSYDSRVSTYAYLAPNQINSSPRFVASAQSICVNSGEPILQSAFDLDGDSLVYSFCPIYHDPLPSDTIPFVAGASYNQPFVGQTVALDSENGIIATPLNSQSHSLIGIQVDEYRNGMLIGTTQRVSYINAFNCQTTGSINTSVLQGNVVNGELQPTVGSEVIVEYSASVSDPENYYLYCTTCEHLEDYTWTTTTDIPNGILTATLNWTPVAHELEVPLHVRLLQASCEGDFSSTTMLFSIQDGTVTGVDELSESTVMVYPNPSRGQLFIESATPITAVEIVDLSGRVLKAEQFKSGSIKFQLSTSLASGTFSLRLLSEWGVTVKNLIISN